jgi:hypothetical protein
MKPGKPIFYIAFLVSSLFFLGQFSNLLLIEFGNSDLYGLVNNPIECETGEDINELELKEHKILNRDYDKLSNLLISFTLGNSKHYLNHPVDVILDVKTPPPEV